MRVRSPRRGFKQQLQTEETAPAPISIVIDSREQHPYTFQGLRQDRSDGGRLLEVRRHWRQLKSGDYSIDGFEDRVSVERKSLPDLYRTFSRDRERFQREFERLAKLDFAAVVIEASWPQILAGWKRSRLNPKIVWRTVLSWSIKYPVHWFTFENRRLSEIGTYRLLERWWKLEREVSGAIIDTTKR